MALSLVTAPVDEPITLTEAQLHLRVDVSDEDDLIFGLIPAARSHIETCTGRMMMSQTWDLKLDGFPCGPIWLPYPPVSSVTSVSYVDQNGTTQTWSSSLYTTDLPAGPQAMPARILPAYQQIYPVTRGVPNAVTVRFVCGYANAAAVPDMLKVCMKEHVRANYGRGIEDRDEIMEWITRNWWSFKAF